MFFTYTGFSVSLNFNLSTISLGFGSLAGPYKQYKNACSWCSVKYWLFFWFAFYGQNLYFYLQLSSLKMDILCCLFRVCLGPLIWIWSTKSLNWVKFQGKYNLLVFKEWKLDLDHAEKDKTSNLKRENFFWCTSCFFFSKCQCRISKIQIWQFFFFYNGQWIATTLHSLVSHKNKKWTNS